MRINVFLLIIIMFIPIVHAATSTTVSNSKVDLTLEIVNGYYTDFEGDGLKNDVIVEYEFSLTLWTHKIGNDYYFNFYNDLIQPSGLNHNYKHRIYLSEVSKNTEFLTINPNYDSDDGEFYLYTQFKIKMVYWDHAIESGWYIISSGIEILEGGFDYGTAELVFDPPGGTTGTTPPSPTILYDY